MAPRTDTRKKILNITERMLMRRGYHAFSYQHIAAELAIKPAAVHYHFRTKPALVIAAIERYGRKFDAWERTVAEADAASRLLAYVDVGRQVVAMERVCALGMLTAQLQTVPDDVQDVASSIQRRVLRFYVDAFEEGRRSGTITFTGSAAAAGAAMSCAIIGAQQLARAFGPAVYDDVMAHHTSLLGLQWPAPELAP